MPNNLQYKITHARELIPTDARPYLRGVFVGPSAANGRNTYVLDANEGGVYGVAGILAWMAERWSQVRGFLDAKKSNRLTLSTALCTYLTDDPEGPRLNKLRVTREQPVRDKLSVSRQIRKILLRLNPSASRPALTRATVALVALVTKRADPAGQSKGGGLDKSSIKRVVREVLREESVRA